MMRFDFMVEFRIRAIKGAAPEKILLRVSQISALYPEHGHIRLTNGDNAFLLVHEEDWPKVEKAFRLAYLAQEVRPKNPLSLPGDYTEVG